MKNKPELKGCPFCGSTDIKKVHLAIETNCVGCYICKAQTGRCKTMIEAVNDWNKGLFALN